MPEDEPARAAGAGRRVEVLPLWERGPAAPEPGAWVGGGEVSSGPGPYRAEPDDGVGYFSVVVRGTPAVHGWEESHPEPSDAERCSSTAESWRAACQRRLLRFPP
ncbi:hypothetical protein C2142_03230 [Streptomyces sp. CB01881]|nr:hypothetical protein C2142_03230 [Streptomyces sp. CB01881]